ncbi:MAG: ArsA family ATPase [Actinobacteria bacterium]|nr:ArsA family ATPase [Actinomycetota bacterium]MCL6105558.1 ArsA family ATPase [Actinomycetota bacterium]
MSDLLERKLVFITGKGGVGKTTVSAALALLAAQKGKKVLVCEVDAKGDLASFFEVDELVFKERQVSAGLWAMSMDTEASLREYLKLFLKIPLVGRIGPLAKAFDFVATAAPGVKEILIVGKFCWEVKENSYDMVIVDAAATGHIVGQLAAPQAINNLVKVGLIRSQTDWMLDILSDPSKTGLCIVATPEEMPIAETLELVNAMGEQTTVDLIAVIVNKVLPELFTKREEDIFESLCVAKAIKALNELLDGDVTSVLEGASLAVKMRRSRTSHLKRLRQELPEQYPIYYLPYMFRRTEGLRATHQIVTALSEELGI